MFTLEIKESGVKDFMNKLLKEVVFDGFEVRGVEINALTRFEISGIIIKNEAQKKEDDEPQEKTRNFCSWAELRPTIFQIIKGGKRPHSMKIVFSYPSEKSQDFHQNSAALFFNVSYEGDAIICTTATSQKNFSLERQMDDKWEDYIREFLIQNQIVSTI